MEKKYTEGSIFKNIVSFSIPFLISYFLQTLYGMADLFIIGQFKGSDAISAVSIGSQIMHMLTVIIVGLSMGTSVLLGQAVGAREKEKIKTIIGNTISFFTFLSIFLTVLLFFLTPLIVSLVQTPIQSVKETLSYLKISFLGLPFIIFYNVIASIFRGRGDSRTPLYFVTIACILNIFLDFLFIEKFSLSAKGAALATIISQGISVVFGLVMLVKDFSKSEKGRPHFKFKIDSYILSEILKIGLPISAQDGFIQVSFIVITIIANKRGVDVAASVGIVEKIITFLFLVPSSMLSSISSIASQNIGAGNYERAKKTLWSGMIISCSLGIAIAVFFQFASRGIISLFTNEEEVVKLGTQYLKAYVCDCFFAAIHFCFSGYFSAIGKSIISFIHNSISIIFIRIPGAYLASIFWPDNLYPMGWAAPLGSMVSALICFILHFLLEKAKKTQEN